MLQNQNFTKIVNLNIKKGHACPSNLQDQENNKLKKQPVKKRIIKLINCADKYFISPKMVQKISHKNFHLIQKH